LIACDAELDVREHATQLRFCGRAKLFAEVTRLLINVVNGPSNNTVIAKFLPEYYEVCSLLRKQIGRSEVSGSDWNDFRSAAGAKMMEAAHHSATHPRHVLVVDDEPSVGRTIVHAAEACGCTAGLAISAEAFRAQYEREVPDVILLDLSLPGGDGIELLRMLADEGCEALVMIVSGFDARVMDAALRLGTALGLKMGASLNKPFTVRQLAEALASRNTARSAGGQHELCLG
jgi:CheY-like chemotaxis protein